MRGASPRVLFFTPFGSYTVHHQFDAVVATALRLRGCEVLFACCDGIYEDCDVLAHSGKRARSHCRKCAKTGKQFFGRFDLPSVQLRDLITKQEVKEARRWAEGLPPLHYGEASYRGLPMGKWVTSSVFTYFRISPSSLGDPEVRSVHREMLVNGVKTHIAMERLLDRYNPTHMVLFNGRMAPYRLAFECARRRDVPVVVHERGYINDTFITYENLTVERTAPFFRIGEAWGNVALSSESLGRVKRYLSEREGGTDSNYPSFYDYTTEPARIRSLLDIPAEARIFGVFTSSEFELGISEDYRGLRSQLELIDRLIDVFRNRGEYLVVRHHPYIYGDSSLRPDLHFLSRARRQAEGAPANVRVLMPYVRINSYGLLHNVDACISFFSTIGIEAASRGVPTAMFANSPYSPGVYRSIGDLGGDDLGALVGDLMEHSGRYGVDDLAKAYRNISSWTERLCTRYASFGFKDHFQADLRFSTPQELVEGRDPALDRMCSHVLGGSSLMVTPGKEDLARDDAAERAFLGRELREIRELRRRVREECLARAPAGTAPELGVLRYPPSGELFPELAEKAAAAVEPLIAFEGHRLVSRDPLCWNACIHALQSDGRGEFPGVVSGAWVVSTGGVFRGEVFTKRVPAGSFREMLAACPVLADPFVLLSLAVFRKEALAGILEALAETGPGQRAARLLLEAYRKSFFAFGAPMIYIQEEGR